MVWRHYRKWRSGECAVIGSEAPTPYEMGIVETGRSRVFVGFYVRLMLEDREPVTGEDEHSLRGALCCMAEEIEPLGLHLDCVGLDADFSESGLSFNSGWGYLGPRQQPMHMMDATPLYEDEISRETMDAARVGLA